MKKILAGIFSIFLLCQNCLASQLYFISNPSANTILNIVENSYKSNSYVLTKRNPYYATNSKNEFAIVLIKEDSNGMYYYFDGDNEVNNDILKGFKKKGFIYTEVNTKLKQSFDTMASEQIFGKKKEYLFEDTSSKQNEEYERRNFPVTKADSNTLYGYVGKLETGTEIPAYLQSALNTESVQKGDLVTLVLSQDLEYNGKVVAQQGSLVQGTVTKAKSAGYARQNGQIVIEFDNLLLPSGKKYKISTEKIEFKIESNEGDKAAIVKKTVLGAATAALITLACVALRDTSNIGRAVAIGAGVGAVAGAASEGLKKGVNAEIPAYTEIKLILTQPLSVMVN